MAAMEAHRDFDGGGVWRSPIRLMSRRFGAHQPAGGVETDVCALHIGVERGSNCCDDARAGAFVHFLQNTADWT